MPEIVPKLFNELPSLQWVCFLKEIQSWSCSFPSSVPDSAPAQRNAVPG